MIVCVCKRVSDTRIRAAVEAGATSFEAVQHQLGVSTGCGRCESYARQVVKDSLGGTVDTLSYPAVSGFRLQLS